MATMASERLLASGLFSSSFHCASDLPPTEEGVSGMPLEPGEVAWEDASRGVSGNVLLRRKPMPTLPSARDISSALLPGLGAESGGRGCWPFVTATSSNNKQPADATRMARLLAPTLPRLRIA